MNIKYISILFIVSLALCSTCSAIPVITNQTNDHTTTNYMNVVYGDTVQFTVTANESIATWSWLVDGVDQYNNNNVFSYQFNDAHRHIISVYGTSAGGTSETSYYYVMVNTEIATTTTSQIPNVEISNFSDAIDGEIDPTGIANTAIYPYTITLKSFAYLFLYCIFFYYSWNKSETIVLPAVVFILLSQYIIGVVPETVVDKMILIVGVAMLSVFYVLFGKESR